MDSIPGIGVRARTEPVSFLIPMPDSRSLSRPDCGARLFNDRLRRRLERLDQLLHGGAGQRRNVDVHLLGVSEILRVAHGRVERARSVVTSSAGVPVAMK